jgi:DNA-binding beta-propeller fold protein YncE
VDSRGNVFYVNRIQNSIGMISPSGAMTVIAGGGNVEGGFADGNGNAARFNAPMGLALDAQGNIYVADFGNDRIRKISLK